MVEQRTENPCVPGSIPGGTTKKDLTSVGSFFMPNATFGYSLVVDFRVLFFRKKEPKTSSRQKLAFVVVPLFGYRISFLAFPHFTFLFLDIDLS